MYICKSYKDEWFIKNKTMNTAVKHKEIIDIPEDIFSSLSMMAVAGGTSLKKYIEMILIEKAEEVRDTELYKKLLTQKNHSFS